MCSNGPGEVVAIVMSDSADEGAVTARGLLLMLDEKANV